MIKTTHFARAFFASLTLLISSIATISRADESAPDAWAVLVNPENAFAFSILKGQKAIGQISIAGWGPNWAWTGLSGKPRTGDTFSTSAPFVVNKATGQVIDVQLHVTQTDARTLQFQYDITAAKDVPLTLLAATLTIDKSLPGQFIANSGATDKTIKLPLNKDIFKDVAKAEFQLEGLGNLTATLDPAVSLGIDNGARFILAEQKFPAGKKTLTLKLTFPADAKLLTTPADLEKFSTLLAGKDWFAFLPTNRGGESVIGMGSWLEKPAGKRGGVQTVGDHFQLDDGTPIKFWGTNLSYGGNCAPTAPPPSSPPAASPNTASTPSACTSSPTPKITAASAISTTPPSSTPQASTASIILPPSSRKTASISAGPTPTAS